MVEDKRLEITPELQQMIEKYENICKILEVRKKERGIEFYIPNPVQYKAHCSKAKVIAVVKGNRLGGSTWGTTEVVMHITKQYPEWFPKSRRFKGPIKVRIATDRFAKIDNVIEPKLRAYFPKDWWSKARIRRSPQGYIYKIHFPDGSSIEFLTMEQEQMAFEGQDLDLFWGDEPVKRSLYVATQRGLLDRAGLTILSFTPLIEPWMKEEIVDKADGKGIEVFYGTTRDNMFDIKGNPILREEDIKRFEDMLTEDERQTRIYGKFFHLRGLVYTEFDSQVHCVDDFAYEVGYPVICILDPHDRLPHHVIWAMVNKIDDVYVMYEFTKHCGLRKLAANIKAIEKHFGWNVVKRLIDPNFGKSPSKVGSRVSVIQELANYRCSFFGADDGKEAGRLKVKDMLHYNKNKPLDIDNKPKLFFVKSTCPKTIHSMQNLQHDDWKGTQDRDPKEDVKPKDEHGAHCVRYLCNSTPTYDLPVVYEEDLAGVY